MKTHTRLIRSFVVTNLAPGQISISYYGYHPLPPGSHRKVQHLNKHLDSTSSPITCRPRDCKEQ